MERAWVVAEECPLCGEPVLVQKNRTTGEPFISCSGWKATGCRFTEPYDARLQRLGRENDALDRRCRELETAMRPRHADTAERKELANKLRDLMAIMHPDKNPAGLDPNRVVAELSHLRDWLLGR